MSSGIRRKQSPTISWMPRNVHHYRRSGSHDERISRRGSHGQARPATQRERSSRTSFHPLEPAGEPGSGYVHRKALERERQEPQIAGRGHLKYLGFLKDRKSVMPFCPGPVVPKLPEPAANPSGEKKSVEAARKTFGEVAEKRGQRETAIHRVEEKEKSEPDENEKIRGDALGNDQRDREARRAASHYGVLRRPGNRPRLGRERRQQCLHEIGSL